MRYSSCIFSWKRRYVLMGFLLVIKALVLIPLWISLSVPSNLTTSGAAYAKDEQSKEVKQAEPTGQAASPAPTPPSSKDLLLSIQKEREALKKREDALKKKEEQVADEEARLQKVQVELDKKLEMLTQIQVALQTMIQQKKGLDDETLKKLARVYESTPPEQAGPMLSKLDTKLGAQILIRMDGRKAGKIWGFVSPERASEISAEITRLK